MEPHDDELLRFEAEGPPPLPATDVEGTVENRRARIWYATFGDGEPVVLLHGGLGNAGNWGHQVPGLLRLGRRVVVIDSRGHGRSTWDGSALAYTDMASDVSVVMDALAIGRAHLAGWSDGAVTALMLAAADPGRVAGVLFFGCNVDASGTKPFALTPAIERCLSRHQQDHARLSATPERFDALAVAVGEMQRAQPDLSRDDLAAIDVLVTVVHAEHDEFIRSEHAAYVAEALPHAELVRLDGVSHFAPVQRPATFDRAVAAFLARSPG